LKYDSILEGLVGLPALEEPVVFLTGGSARSTLRRVLGPNLPSKPGAICPLR